MYLPGHSLCWWQILPCQYKWVHWGLPPGKRGVRLKPVIALQWNVWRRAIWKGIPLPNGFCSSYKWWVDFGCQWERLSPGHIWYIDRSGSWHKLSKNVRNDGGGYGYTHSSCPHPGSPLTSSLIPSPRASQRVSSLRRQIQVKTKLVTVVHD